MPRSTTRIVSPEELHALFVELKLWEQILSGALSSVEALKKTVPAKSYENAFSQILKHYDVTGRHVCTTHRIISSDGEVLHWDEADVKLEGETVIKSHVASVE